jgi:hypothetical protein
MLRIELDDLSRPQVLALVHEHLQNMHELSPPDKVFAFDVRKLKAADVTFWTAWRGDVLLGCAAAQRALPDSRRDQVDAHSGGAAEDRGWPSAPEPHNRGRSSSRVSCPVP